MPTARFMPLASVTLMLPASATRPDAVTVALFEATWPLLIPIETDAPLVQAAFDEVICTFQSPSNVAAADGVAKPSRSKQRSGDAEISETVIMTCPFGLDTIRISQRLPDDCDCHHAVSAQRKAPRCGGAFVDLRSSARRHMPVS